MSSIIEFLSVPIIVAFITMTTQHLITYILRVKDREHDEKTQFKLRKATTYRETFRSLQLIFSNYNDLIDTLSLVISDTNLMLVEKIDDSSFSRIDNRLRCTDFLKVYQQVEASLIVEYSKYLPSGSSHTLLYKLNDAISELLKIYTQYIFPLIDSINSRKRKYQNNHEVFDIEFSQATYKSNLEFFRKILDKNNEIVSIFKDNLEHFTIEKFE